MERSKWEVIILKPTPVFLSFLAAQVSEDELPDLELLKTDCTAYAIPKQPTDDALLEAIERNYAFMFKHEIRRWLGEQAKLETEASFFDFLCCFKFEIHSQIVLMEPHFQEGQQLLCLKPRSVLIKWMQSSVADDGELISILDRVNVSNLAENSTLIVKNFRRLTDVRPFVEQHFKTFYEAEMSRMCDKSDQWPEVETFDDFSRYFTMEIHTQMIHLP